MDLSFSIPSQVPNLTKSQVATLISGSVLSLQKVYVITDATASENKRIVVFSKANNALSDVAINLTDGTFGTYAADVFTPLSTGVGVTSVTGDGVSGTTNVTITFPTPLQIGAYPSSNPSGYTTESVVEAIVNLIAPGLAPVQSVSGNIVSGTTAKTINQIQSDWNAVSGLGEILNKPTIPTTVDVPYSAAGFGAQIAASSTRWNPVRGSTSTLMTASGQIAIKIQRATVFKNALIRTNSSQSANNSFVITLASGPNPAALVDSSVVFTIAAGSAAGEFTSANTLSVPADDYAAWKQQNNANTLSAQIGCIAMIGTQTI